MDIGCPLIHFFREKLYHHLKPKKNVNKRFHQRFWNTLYNKNIVSFFLSWGLQSSPMWLGAHTSKSTKRKKKRLFPDIFLLVWGISHSGILFNDWSEVKILLLLSVIVSTIGGYQTVDIWVSTSMVLLQQMIRRLSSPRYKLELN